MYKINDYIIYKREVCKINDILPKFFKDNDYYLLSPLSDDTLTIKVPVNNKEIRSLITKKDIDKIINDIPDIEPVNSDTKSLEGIYKDLLSSGSHADLIKIIKTTYLRNKERIDNNKKTTDKENYYFNLAEKYLYQEFQIVLNLTYDEAKDYVINKVEKLSKWFFYIIDMVDCYIKDINYAGDNKSPHTHKYR